MFTRRPLKGFSVLFLSCRFAVRASSSGFGVNPAHRKQKEGLANQVLVLMRMPVKSDLAGESLTQFLGRAQDTLIEACSVNPKP